jgi:hypothetical protein
MLSDLMGKDALGLWKNKQAVLNHQVNLNAEEK